MQSNDYLVRLAQRPLAQRMVKTLRIPVPMPESLQRAEQPWQAKELAGKRILLSTSSTLHAPLLSILQQAGAEVVTDEPFNGLVFDATQLKSPQDLKQAYHFFHQNLLQLSPNGRALILGLQPRPDVSMEENATRHALEGFVRSLGKELGPRGSTAQLLSLSDELMQENNSLTERLLLPVSFFLSNRSAFISGQPIILQNSLSSKNESSLAQSLAKKIALVTGSAQGIGAAIAQRMSEEGASVIVLDRPEEEEKAAQLAEKIGGTLFLQDLAEADAAQKIHQFVMERFGGLDILVNNAGITRDKTLAKMDERRWDLSLQVNLHIALELSRVFVDDGLKEGGRVICMSSIGGIGGNYGQTNYAAAKSGLMGMVEALSRELVPISGTANAIAPGFIETRMVASMPFFTREAARRLSSVSQGGLPIDIAEAAVFLASPAAHSITGQTLRVCGGNLMGA